MRKLFLFFVVLPLLLVILYGAAWLLFYINARHALETMVADSKSNPSFELYDENPKISGFPTTPKITYTKGFMVDGVKVTFPEITISGYLLPLMPIEVNAPKGFNISYRNSGRKSLEVTKGHLIAEVPWKLLKSFEYQNVVNWQRDVGEIKIRDLELSHDEFYLKGHGVAGFNGQLQPELLLHSQVKNYREFAGRIMEEQGLSGFASAMALSVLDAMSTKDDGTVEFDISIKDREIRVGPIYAGKMPIIYWER